MRSWPLTVLLVPGLAWASSVGLQLEPLGELYAVVAISAPQTQGTWLELPAMPRAGAIELHSAWLARPAMQRVAAGPARRLALELDWDRVRLSRLRQSITITLELRTPEGHRELAVRTWPPTEVPYFVTHAVPERRDQSWLFAVFVEPRARALDALVRDLPERKLRAREVLAAAEQNYAELLAAWSALEPLRLRYLLAASRERQGIAIQRVRRVTEVIERRAANCVESSVLLASVLERRGLPVALVFEPGHMWLALELEDGYAYVETTELTRIAADADLGMRASWERLHRALGLGYSRAVRHGASGPRVLDWPAYDGSESPRCRHMNEPLRAAMHLERRRRLG